MTNQPPHLLIDYNELTYQTRTAAVDMSEVVDPQKHTAAAACVMQHVMFIPGSVELSPSCLSYHEQNKRIRCTQIQNAS